MTTRQCVSRMNLKFKLKLLHRIKDTSSPKLVLNIAEHASYREFAAILGSAAEL